jgi:hypothetical protein
MCLGYRISDKKLSYKKIRNIVLVDNPLELSPFHEDIFFIEQIYKIIYLFYEKKSLREREINQSDFQLGRDFLTL